MEEPVSPLVRIMQHPDFKPFSGPHAFQVLQKAKNRLNLSNVELDDVLKAVSSLGLLLETEIALIYALQETLCTRCTNCCNTNKSLLVTKQELKNMAKSRRVSYKKLKRSLRAVPNNDGTVRFRRKPCPFLARNDCTVYPVRPGECRNYPASNLIMALTGGKPYPVNCPISDDLLSEIVVKRTLEEKMFRENPELLQEFTEKRRRDNQRIAGLSSVDRMRYLINRYQNTLSRG